LSNAPLRVQLDEDDSFRVDHLNPLLDLVSQGTSSTLRSPTIST